MRGSLPLCADGRARLPSKRSQFNEEHLPRERGRYWSPRGTKEELATGRGPLHLEQTECAQGAATRPNPC